jgi:hypothetical protein
MRLLSVSSFVLFCLASGVTMSVAAPPDSIRCYVWDFTTRDGKRNEITRHFTVEFEEKLAQQGFCKVLERRNFARLISHRDNEKAVQRLDGISQATVDTLKAYDANTVVFGEVYDDINSGEYRITVTFQNFDNTINVWSVRMPRGLVNDASNREQKMEELAAKAAHRPPLPDGRDERRKAYLQVSRMLREFHVRATRLNTLCSYLPELAYGNKRAEEDLAASVIAYNQIHDSLTINQNAFIESVDQVWHSTDITREVENLLRFALDDIHRTDIVAFNQMFVLVMNINNNRVTDKHEVEKIRSEIKRSSADRVSALTAKLELLDASTTTLLNKLKP